MNRIRLTDKQWEPIRDYLRGHPRVYVGNERGCRQFVEAVLWILRSGGGCLRRMGVGIAYSSDFHAGVSMACGLEVHALTDALGSPLRFILTGGPESDIGQAANLLAGIHAGARANRTVQRL